jgi:hypothetical protein
LADVTLFLATGRVSGSVWSHVRDRDPVFTWIEPRPDAVTALAGRRADVTGVYAGLPDLGGLPVEEMRLSWEDALLHMIDDGDGVRWAAWATAIERMPRLDDQEGEPRRIEALERRAGVVWRQASDMERFHGAGGLVISLHATRREFRQRGRLVTWWLGPETGDAL